MYIVTFSLGLEKTVINCSEICHALRISSRSTFTKPIVYRCFVGAFSEQDGVVRQQDGAPETLDDWTAESIPDVVGWRGGVPKTIASYRLCSISLVCYC